MSAPLNLLRLGLACMASVLAGPALAVSFHCPATLQETPLVKAPDSPWHVAAAAGERTLEQVAIYLKRGG